MNKFYKALEEKIKASGYPREISGRDVYNDICDQIEDKENGTYLVLSKFEDDVTFEYHITIQDEGFNLGILTMRPPDGVFQTEFDDLISIFVSHPKLARRTLYKPYLWPRSKC